MQFTDKQIHELNKPLNPKNIVKASSGNLGPKGDYIEGWHAINEANRIFGFDNWSYLILLTKEDVSLAKDSKGNEQWKAHYTCAVTVHVGDITRQDIGYGSGYAKDIGDAIEGATKEAVTDGLKRALRTFGNQFGLALYDKQKTNVGVPSIADKDLDQIKALVEQLGMNPVVLCEAYNVKSLDKLTEKQGANAINKLNLSLKERGQLNE
jgi:DNA recombination protein Rad52